MARYANHRFAKCIQRPVVYSGHYGDEAEAIFAAFTTPPTQLRKAQISATVAALIVAGVWTKLDFLHVFAAADAQAALINWIDPGTFDATEAGEVTHTADRGYLAGADGSIEVPFNPATAVAPNFVQNSACAGSWSLESGQQESENIAQFGDTISTYIYTSRHTDDKAYARINAASDIEVASLDGSGLWLVTRLDAMTQRLDRNGVQFGSASVASGTIESDTFDTAPRDITGPTAIILAGAGLTTTESAALYAALHRYMNAVGAV